MDTLNKESVLDGLELSSAIADAAEKRLQERQNSMRVRWAVIIAACIAAILIPTLIANDSYNTNTMPSLLAGRTFRGTRLARNSDTLTLTYTFVFSASGNEANRTYVHDWDEDEEPFTDYCTCSYESFFGRGNRRVILSYQLTSSSPTLFSVTYSISEDEIGRLVLTDEDGYEFTCTSLGA